jgi:hypothetical protein
VDFRTGGDREGFTPPAAYVSSPLREHFLCERNYLTGGGRGEKTGSPNNERALHMVLTGGTETLGTSVRKNQKGIRKAKTRGSTGSVTAKSKAVATHTKATSRDAKCMVFIY